MHYEDWSSAARPDPATPEAFGSLKYVPQPDIEGLYDSNLAEQEVLLAAQQVQAQLQQQSFNIANTGPLSILMPAPQAS